MHCKRSLLFTISHLNISPNTRILAIDIQHNCTLESLAVLHHRWHPNWALLYSANTKKTRHLEMEVAGATVRIRNTYLHNLEANCSVLAPTIWLMWCGIAGPWAPTGPQKLWALVRALACWHAVNLKTVIQWIKCCMLAQSKRFVPPVCLLAALFVCGLVQQINCGGSGLGRGVFWPGLATLLVATCRRWTQLCGGSWGGRAWSTVRCRVKWFVCFGTLI